MVNRYQQYKESGIEWLEEIPSTWKVDKLKNYCDIFASNVDKKSDEGEAEVKLCNYVDVYKNEVINRSIEFMVATATRSEIDKFSLRLNDILITKDSETPDDIAVPAIVKETIDNLIAGYHLSIIRCINKFEPDFLIWVLRDLSIATQFHREAVGITRFGLASRHFKNGIIAFPDRSEQTAIANYLDQATAKIDSVISLKQQQLAKLEQYRKSKIHECVTKGVNPKAPMKDSGIEWIGLVPEHWKVEKLKYLTSLIIDGTHFTPNYLDNEDGIPFFRVTDIQTDEIEYSRLKKISQEEYIELNRRCNPEKGDLLLSKNGTIGITKVVTWDYPFSLFVSLCLIKPLEKLNVNFLDYLFKCGFFEQQISDSSKATTVTNLHLEMIKDFSLLKPPIIEQSEIVAHLDSFLESFKLEKSIIEQQILKLQQYRKSLIHECVTGKRKIA